MRPTRSATQARADVGMEWELRRYASVGSTMEVAADLALQGAPAGTVVVADEQTAGRGRLGRAWLAPPGVCLLMTILLRPPLEVARMGDLSRRIAERVAEAVFDVTSVEPRIKEPNDLLIDGKKLAGILVQTSIRGNQLDYLLVGIGLNVNVSPDQLPLPSATSLLAVTGRYYDRQVLLDAVLGRLAADPVLMSGLDVEAEMDLRRRLELP